MFPLVWDRGIVLVSDDRLRSFPEMIDCYFFFRISICVNVGENIYVQFIVELYVGDAFEYTGSVAVVSSWISCIGRKRI